MDLGVYIQLKFLCVVNVIFTFFGIVLNTLVIASFWKSSQLRKKLCHFMIMTLSCFDLVAVITNHPAQTLFLISWLKEDYDLLHELKIYVHICNGFLGSSFYALLVMSIEQYLGAYYPVFHRTSVSRRRLLTLLAIMQAIYTTLSLISADDIVIPRSICTKVFIFTVFPPLIYLNFKLFRISKKMRRRNATSPEKRTESRLKSISSCFLVVFILLVLSIPAGVYIAFSVNRANRHDSNARLSRIWVTTMFAVNCTFNSLIFFWKNKVLRMQGLKILKTLKDRLVGS